MTINVELPSEMKEAAAQLAMSLFAENFASRLANKDSTLWGTAAQSEARLRLNWVDPVESSSLLLPRLKELKKENELRGITRIVLAGMGGSSLAPEVYAHTFGKALTICDTTNPGFVQRLLDDNLAEVLLIVSSKSGSTVETDSQKRIFENACVSQGLDPKDHIIVVTDPDSPLSSSAVASGFPVFHADPHIGGRYSALSAFGIVPAVLLGLDGEKILLEASRAIEVCSRDSLDNPAILLASAILRRAESHVFLGLIESGDGVCSLGDWIEQLIAESTGKNGKGILPIVLSEKNGNRVAAIGGNLTIELAEKPEHCTIKNVIQVTGSIIEQFVLWEFTTAALGRLLHVNPFDQPDVEEAKIASRNFLDKAKTTRHGVHLSEETKDDGDQKTVAFGGQSEDANKSALTLFDFIRGADASGYLAVQGYIDPVLASIFADLTSELARSAPQLTVTSGFGPRFLHSTGQFHKGGPKIGSFVQLCDSSAETIIVPGRDYSLKQLVTAQAAGDAKVLAVAQQRVVTITLDNPQSDLVELRNKIRQLNDETLTHER